MRRLSHGRRKPRGISRRLSGVNGWAQSFKEFPKGLKPDNRYCNWKLPVLDSLVEGIHAKKSVQAKCAQSLINACSHLIAAKPSSARDFRVTCVVCLPDMFASEVCIYLTEEYFQSHTQPAKGKQVEVKKIVGKSLAKEWSLELPKGVYELGLNVDYKEEDWYVSSERWFFGEVLDRLV